VANLEEEAQEPVPPPPLQQQQNPFAAMQFMAQQQPPAQQQPFQQQPYQPPLFQQQQPFKHQPFLPPAPAQPDMVMVMQYQLHQQNQQIQQLLLAMQHAQHALLLPNYYVASGKARSLTLFSQDDQKHPLLAPFLSGSLSTVPERDAKQLPPQERRLVLF
jgi:hypothetical protein